MQSRPRNPIAYRLQLALVLAAICGGAAALTRTITHPQNPSDFAQLWFAAGAFLRGENPYAVVGPGRAFDWGFDLLYPLPAVLIATPFSLMPLVVADVLFVALGVGLFVWAITRTGDYRPQLFALASVAALAVVQTSQWSPLLVAAALTPSLGWLLACKPTIGLALLAAYPSRRAIIGAAALGLLSVAIWPWWVREWLAVLPNATHLRAPITSIGGPLVLLALLRWRRPEARLLAALACIPHSGELYEAIPLFLVARTRMQGAMLSVGTVVIQAVRLYLRPFETYDALTATTQALMVTLLYLPCVMMVLRRPNVGEVCVSPSLRRWYRPQPAGSPSSV